MRDMDRPRHATTIGTGLGTAVIAVVALHQVGATPLLIGIFVVLEIAIFAFGYWPVITGWWAPNHTIDATGNVGRFGLRVRNRGARDRFTGELLKVHWSSGSTAPIEQPLPWGDSKETEITLGPELSEILRLPEPEIVRDNGNLQAQISVPWATRWTQSRSTWQQEVELKDEKYRAEFRYDLLLVAHEREDTRKITVNATTYRRKGGRRSWASIISVEDANFG